MLKYITAEKVDGIICWKLDRLSRNPIDGGTLIWAIKQNNLEIITPSQSFRRDDENSILMYLEFGMAQKYIDDLSKNVKRGNRAKLESGGWTNVAPFGYKNNVIDKTLYLDEARASYVPQMFEMYASGNYSLLEISNVLYKKGLRPAHGEKVRRAKIHTILRNPFYYGMMLKGDRLYRGNHTPLISKKLFDRVQEVFTLKSNGKKRVRFFHLRGMFTCASCGCVLTANKKKGHDYYYCTNGKGNCDQHKTYLRSEVLDTIVAETLRKLQISENLIEVAYEAAQLKLAENPQNYEAIRQSLQNQLIGLKEKQSRLADSFIDGITPEDVYKQKLTDLANKRVELETQLKELQDEEATSENTLVPRT